MTGIEAISKIIKHVEERMRSNSTFYVDIGNPENLGALVEDAEIIGFARGLAGWRNDENESHD